MIGVAVKFLLTSNGISNASIHSALEDLLNKPIGEASALFVPTGMYPFPGGGGGASAAIRGEARGPMCGLGWKSLGLLELTTLTSIQRESWVPSLEEIDALLVWGGSVAYLCYWMRQTGLADLLPSLENLVYVGVSAGSISMTPYNPDAEWNRQFFAPDSEISLQSEIGLGLVDFALGVHLDNPDPIFEDNSTDAIERWAAELSIPTYAIDDETAIAVVGDAVEVVSEGHWRLFNPAAAGA